MATKGRRPARLGATTAVVVGLGCGGLFALGLVSPLTPSQGCASLTAILAFAGVPIAVSAVAAILTAGAVRAAMAGVGLTLAGVTLWLLGQIGCLG